MKGFFKASLAICLISIVSLLLAGEAMAQGESWWESPPKTSLVESKSTNDGVYYINWVTGEIVVEGIGVAEPAPGVSKYRMRRSALIAARKTAQAMFLEYAAGVTVDWTAGVYEGVLTTDKILTRAKGMVVGLREIREPKIEEDKVSGAILAHVWMSTKLSSAINVADELYERVKKTINLKKKEINNNYYPVERVEPLKERYTGLIVDCREVEVRPSLTPKIFDEDLREIYGTLKVNKRWLLEHGLAGYQPSVEDAKKKEKKRIGDHPLVVKADGVKGINQDEVILDNETAKLVVGANKTSNFFNEARVVFVID